MRIRITVSIPVHAGVRAVAFVLAVLAGGCDLQPPYDAKPSCTNDDDCTGQAQYCVSARCNACRDDSHCIAQLDESYVCESGTCVKMPGYCGPPVHECPDGLVCRDAFCGPECYDDEDCAQLAFCSTKGGCGCDDGRCVRLAGCMHYSCAPGMVCRDGDCVMADPCALPEPYLLFWDFDEQVLRADARDAIETFAICHDPPANDDTVTPIVVTCNTDDRRTHEESLALSEKRADVVERALAASGVSAAHVRTRALGKSKPRFDPVETEEDQDGNRRCELEREH